MARRGLRLYQQEGDRHATWLELFFDLVFVVAVATLGHELHGDLTPGGALLFCMLFVPVWWQWIDFSYYADQFEGEDLVYRLSLLLAMFGMLVLARTLPDVWHGKSLGFALTVTGLRALIVALYARAYRLVPESRELTGRYLLSFSVALGLWAASCVVPPPLRYGLWAVALAVEIFNGPITYATIRNVPQQVSHMDERFGLFVIIVLGEAVIAVANGLEAQKQTFAQIGPAGAAFALAGSLWWLYFRRADPEVISRALRSDRVGLLRSYLYGYSHLFLYGGITAAGVGILAALEKAEAALPPATAGVLGVGTATAILATTVVQWSGPGSLGSRVVWVRALVAGLGVAASFLPLPGGTVVLLLGAGATLLAAVEKRLDMPAAA